MSDLIILKLGGSILTLKEKNKPIIRTRTINRIAKEIIKAQAEHKFQLILIHGTGSFGHPVANKHKLNHGLINRNSIWGFAQSKRQGFLVNMHLWSIFEKHNIACTTIQPSAIIQSESGIIKQMDIKILKQMLNLGLVPLLFGDEVIDSKMGFSVCSSDQIATYLASKLKPRRLLFASDVNGVFDMNPKINKTAKTIPLIRNQQLQMISQTMKQHNLMDVSGEMAGKLTSLLLHKISKQTKIQIFNGLLPGQVYQALLGKEVGTKIISS